MRLTLRGNPVELLGTPLKVGDVCSNFKLKDTNFNDVSIYSFPEQRFLVLTVPSLDTPVCNDETCKINGLIGEKIPTDTRVVVISKDLPFAQKRWQESTKSERVTLLSDFPYGEAGKVLGVETSLGLLARACFIFKRENNTLTTTYCQVVQEIASEPNYDELLESLK